MKKKICVYAICKNEAKNVKDWYESMSEADHIIVLDTGSTDDTVQLLEECGVEVHQKIYEHFRFDTARNDSMDLIPEEYNIKVCTDLDERFEPGWAQILKDNWKENTNRALYTYVWSHTQDGHPGLTFIYNKIHDKGVRWYGAAHEHLVYPDGRYEVDETYINLENQIVLHHYPDLTRDRNWYLELCEERVQDNPQDYHSYLLLGNEYRAKKQYDKAIEIYTKCVTEFYDKYQKLQLAGVYYWLGNCYKEKGFAKSAMESYTAGIAEYTLYRDNYYGLAIILADNKLFDMAIGVLNQGLSILPQQHELFWMEDPFTWNYALYDVLSYCYAKKGDYENAIKNATIALSYDTKNEILIAKYNKYLDSYKRERGEN